ncbi:MAG: tetratricopeptide repeat protein [Candidatus Melainabacteria bacterium]
MMSRPPLSDDDAYEQERLRERQRMKPATAPGCQILIILLAVLAIVWLIWLFSSEKGRRLQASHMAEQAKADVFPPVHDEHCTGCDQRQLLAHFETVNIGNLPLREEIAERILASDPENTDIRIKLSQTYDFNGRPDQAIAEYSTLLKDDPKNIDVRQQLMRLLCRENKLDDARALYQESATALGNPDALWHSASCIDRPSIQSNRIPREAR